MRRVSEDELVFYDGIAQRIDGLLGSRVCPLTQTSLAQRIGWNRTSLCSFINRAQKSIPAHFIPMIASTLRVSVEHLMSGQTAPGVQRSSWDPRCDGVDLILDKLSELRNRNVHRMCLIGILPTETLPNRATVANFVDSMVAGASTTAAESCHELIEKLRDCLKEEGVQDVDYIISMSDLLRLPRRLRPYQSFSDDEVVLMLDNLKNEWVRHRGLRIIAVDDSALSPDVNLELAGNISLSVIGSETQVRCHRDLRIDWDDEPQAVRFCRDCLIRLKRSAGFKLHERPSAQQVEQLTDKLLSSVKADSFVGRSGAGTVSRLTRPKETDSSPGGLSSDHLYWPGAATGDNRLALAERG